MTKPRTARQLLALHGRLLDRMDREYGTDWPLPETCPCLDPLTLRCMEHARRLYESEVSREMPRA